MSDLDYEDEDEKEAIPTKRITYTITLNVAEDFDAECEAYFENEIEDMLEPMWEVCHFDVTVERGRIT